MRNRSTRFAPCLVFLLAMLTSFGAKSAPAPVLAVIDPMPKIDFEATKQKIIKSYLSTCSGCELRNITPYNADGQFDSRRVQEQLEQVPSDRPAVVLALWNRKGEEGDKTLMEKVKVLGQRGVLFVATAGRPEINKPIVGLSRTLWGQTPEVVIIGELNERERLPLGSYFGPEMLTAIRTPADFMGQDMAAMLFSARLLKQVKNRSSAEWISFLKNKKATSKRMWPQLDEFFGNQ